MGTVYIDKPGCDIRVDGNSLVFHKHGMREGAVPIKPLKRVVVIGRCTIDSGVFHRLALEGVQVVMLSGRGLRFRCIVQGRVHNNGIIRLKQYEKATSEDFANGIAIDLVLEKTKNQIALLEESIEKRPDCKMHITDAIEKMKNLYNLIRVNAPGMESLRGYEGTASNFYFGAYTKLFPESLSFNGRNRRPPRDPVNAMLSLSYTMLYADISTEIYIAGLDPTIGFYHTFEYGRDSLSCDIEEPLRPEVDRFVWELFRSGSFRERDFVEEKGGVYLKKKARARFYPLYEEFAKELRKKVQGNLRGLIGRLMEDEEDALSLPEPWNSGEG
ncbi:MAG: CRISPR-associated endonuclease Cas1 [Nitrospirae bacterium]|nr:MAG: CRISPR-associated endonuclease Cas1 [Nitrospirota bacterium]